jgi:DNA-binding NarL/FixJ family response regulator
LRAAGRLREAREPLRIAEDMFADMGMDAFGDRARAALVAAGAKPRARVRNLRDELTPQEQQIAGLARVGLTNAQIGSQLFLSPRTVEWHLHKVFGKLGIDSRDGLDGLIPRQERDGVPQNG